MGSLYRKYRPRSLGAVVGQESVTKLLANSLKNGHIAQSYLLTGPHGVGKTSVARILAHEINKLDYSTEDNNLDIIEIDAASNNGVEDIRNLRERVHFAPAHAAKKVYIIDEVHMLSKSAFNALLKTLEEPPDYVVFILATTEPDKLPSTIISRVQRYNFRPIDHADIIKQLSTIAKKEAIKIDIDALEIIADFGQGSFRDSIGALDQLRNLASGDENITASDVISILAIPSSALIDELLQATRDGNLAAIINIIDSMQAQNIAINQIIRQLATSLRGSISNNPAEISLLESLLNANSTNFPYLKLLTILAQYNLTRAPQQTAEITTTKAKAKEQKPPQKPRTMPLEASPSAIVKPAATEQPRVSSEKAFSWTSFLDAIKASNGALHAILAKSDYTLADNTLTLFVGSSFAARKLATPKYSEILVAELTNNSSRTIEITVIPTKKPPIDSQSASIVAIMGGGEEVELHGN